ncbi:unnamed protein product, partial [Mesorhabditis spiculigera]
MHWQSLLIPILPASLIEMLHAPIPYLISVPKRNLLEWSFLWFIDEQLDNLNKGFSLENRFEGQARIEDTRFKAQIRENAHAIMGSGQGFAKPLAAPNNVCDHVPPKSTLYGLIPSNSAVYDRVPLNSNVYDCVPTICNGIPRSSGALSRDRLVRPRSPHCRIFVDCNQCMNKKLRMRDDG